MLQYAEKLWKLTMSEQKLSIAMELIEALAGQPVSSLAGGQGDQDQAGAKRVIEAARSSYVLPSFCAEINGDAKECIHCIVEHEPPTICLAKINEPVFEDFEIEWDTLEK